MTRTVVAFFSICIATCFCGCAKHELTFAEARPLFKAGMSTHEVEMTYGKTPHVYVLKNAVIWTYEPDRAMSRDMRAHIPNEYSGFCIWFVDGKAVKIDEVITDVGSPHRTDQR